MADTHRHGQTTFLLVLLFQQTLGALTFPIAKFGLEQIEPFTFAFFRFLISAAVLLFIARSRHQQPAVSRVDMKKIIGLGFLIIPFNQTAYLFGQKMTAAGHGALLFATVPIWIFLGALFYLKERFNWRRTIGMVVALLGVALVISSGAVDMGVEYLLGDLLILMAVMAWAAYTVLGKPLVVKYGAFRVTAYALSSGTALYFPFGLFRALRFDYSGISMGAWLSVLYVALGVSVTAYVLWYWLLKHLEASRIAVYHNLQPVIATVVAYFFLNEPIRWTFVAGGLVVLAGVIVTELE